MQEGIERPRRGRVVLMSIAGLVVVALVVAGLMIARNGNSDSKNKGKKKNDKEEVVAAPVEIAEVRRGSITTFLETTAALEARNTAVLVASRQGPVRAIHAEEGQWVQKGAVLARLDDTEARLAVERAEVTSQIARRELERGQQLKERGFLSDKDLDDLELKARSAKVTLDEARYALSQTRIEASFAGRVTARMINLGETVTAGRECFRVEDFDPLLARIYFPERELPHVKVGQPALVTLDAMPNQTFQARVALVNPIVDRSNGTFKVTLEVRDPSRMLRPGNFARVRLRTGTYDQAVVLPRRAMISEDGENFVFVAHGDSVQRVGVTVGAISGDTAQIVAGLVEGDSVVTVGQGGLKQGSRIKPVKL